MALALNKIIISGLGANTPGAYSQIVSLTANTSGTVIPAGTYVIFPTANVTIQAVSAYNTNTACTTPATWSVVLANNTGGMIISDGVNFAANATGTSTTVTAITVDGGQAASQTYNS